MTRSIHTSRNATHSHPTMSNKGANMVMPHITLPMFEVMKQLGSLRHVHRVEDFHKSILNSLFARRLITRYKGSGAKAIIKLNIRGQRLLHALKA